MAKYLTVCDLDDTLLTKKKTIRYKERRFIRKYIKKGNYFILCTGRPYNGSIKFYRKLKVKMPFVTDNGASIYYPDGNLKTFGIDLAKFKEILALLDEAIECGISTNNQVISIQNRKKVPEWILHLSQETKIIEGKLIDILDEDPLLPNLWIKENYIELFNEVMEKYQDVVAYRNWGLKGGCYGIEIFAKETSKGNTMLYLANELGILHTNTCAFGDQWNDVSMIEKAFYGVAMINGAKVLKDIAKYQTEKDNNHHGVIHFIKKYHLY